MRTTMNSIHQSSLFSLNKVLQELQQLNAKVTTGKEMSRVSDDPIRMSSALSLRTNLAEIEQYQRNMLFGENMLDAAQDALTQLQSVVGDAKNAAIQLASSSTDPTIRENSASLARNFLEQIVSLANSQVAGKFLFAGYRTSGYSATEPAPYIINENDGSVAYTGDTENSLEIAIGRNSRLEVSKNGQELFLDSGLFSLLRTFENVLRGEFTDITGTTQATDTTAQFGTGGTGLELESLVQNGTISFTVTDYATSPPTETVRSVPVNTSNTPDDIAAAIDSIPELTASWGTDGRLNITSSDPDQYTFSFTDSSNFLQAAGITDNQAQSQSLQQIAYDLQTVFDGLTDNISDMASKSKRLEIQRDIYDSLNVATTEDLSELEDTNLAKAVMELKAKEVAYEAALSAASKTLQMSLLNFL